MVISMNMKKTISVFVASALLSVSAISIPTQAQGLDLDQLLNLVKKGQAQDNKEYNARMKRFLADKKRKSKFTHAFLANFSQSLFTEAWHDTNNFQAKNSQASGNTFPHGNQAQSAF